MPNSNNNQNSTQTSDDQVSQTPTDQKPPIIVDESILPPMPEINQDQKIQQSPDQKLIDENAPNINDGIDTTPATNGSAAPADDLVMPEVIGTTPPRKKFAGGKVIATILGLFLLVGGVGAGVFLTGENQNINERADVNTDCAPVYDSVTQKWSSPANCTDCEILQACQATVGACAQEYAADCGDNPTFELIAECKEINAYSSTWAPLDSAGLSQLRAGDQVSFCAIGRTNSRLPFTAARFMINGQLRPETSATRPGGVPNEFCDTYTIPAGVNKFDVSAQVKLLRRWR